MVGNLGQKDGFILKLRNDGQLLSKVLTGGTEMDGLYTIRQSMMGKIYAMGQSSSTIGQVKPKGPVGDIWIATIETNGNVSNHAMLGGADTDIARGATPTSDGGFIIAGNSDSVDGDVTKNNGATDFWLVKVGLPLPATLRSFTATITPEQSIKLNWLSLNETKSKNFTIERSFDQIKFTALGQVTAAGTTATAKAYTFTDQKPVFGKNYYRLKVYDEANKEYIYKTVSVVVYILANEPLVVDNGLTVFPNPIKEPAFYIHTTQILPKHISFFNGIGNPLPIEAESIDSTQTKISIKQEISAGIYFLVLDFDGNKIIKKVIVQ